MSGTNENLEYAFFYTSENGDRKYDATSFEYWLKKFFTTGVFANELQVLANDDMTVTVGNGYTNIDGKVRFFEQAQTHQIETAHATYDRIDSIVVERNDTDRNIIQKVIKGGYSSEPTPPIPVRENGIYQLVIAHVYVTHGAVRITQANITDTRTDMDLCGVVTGTVTEYDFSQFQAQFDSYTEQEKEEFEIWFNTMKNQLSQDAAGNLQNEIGILANLITTSKNNLVSAINEVKEAVDNMETLTSIEEVEACQDLSAPVGAGAVKELNQSLVDLENKIELGSNSIRFTKNNNAYTNITFTKEYDTPPIVFCVSKHASVAVSPSAITTTGFQAIGRVFYGSTLNENVVFNYMAIDTK